MKASELINQLQQLMATNGDCEIATDLDDWCFQGVDYQAPRQLLNELIPPRFLLAFEDSEYCCVHCGACVAEDENDEGEIPMPEVCPHCDKNPQGI